MCIVLLLEKACALQNNIFTILYPESHIFSSRAPLLVLSTCRETLPTCCSDWLWILIDFDILQSRLVWTDKLFVAGILLHCVWLGHSVMLKRVSAKLHRLQGLSATFCLECMCAEYNWMRAIILKKKKNILLKYLLLDIKCAKYATYN